MHDASHQCGVGVAIDQHCAHIVRVSRSARSYYGGAHDVSDGGLAVTLAESCFGAKGLGAHANLDERGLAEAAVFNERGARVVVSVTPSKLATVLNTARQYSVAAHQIGQVIRGDAFRIQYKGNAVIDSTVPTLRYAWANSLESMVVRK